MYATITESIDRFGYALAVDRLPKKCYQSNMLLEDDGAKKRVAMVSDHG
jgi:hypothetical protein